MVPAGAAGTIQLKAGLQEQLEQTRRARPDCDGGTAQTEAQSFSYLVPQAASSAAGVFQELLKHSPLPVHGRRHATGPGHLFSVPSYLVFLHGG